MVGSRLMKSPNLGVIFQLTELERAEGGDRTWEVHDVERQRGFRVTLAAEELRAQAAGTGQRPWAEAEVEQGILVALEKALQAPPEKLPGEVYEVAVTGVDLLDAR
jgi:hypothetical protein